MAQATLDARTRMGPVTLTVADVERQADFYTGPLGFFEHGRDTDRVRLGAGGEDLLILAASPGARRVRGTTGLFHFAVLLPSRPQLGAALKRFAGRGGQLEGATDHLVSEALYLSDPEGNGIELYRDRPRGEWPYEGREVRMSNEPLDLEGILAEAPRGQAADAPYPPETKIGHVHLRVAEIAASEEFYMSLLGLDLTTRFGRAASFFSAGGYHHHVAVNTWAGVGAPAPPPGAAGLGEFTIVVPDAAELTRVAGRLREGGAQVVESSDGVRTVDPSGNALRIYAANGLKQS